MYNKTVIVGNLGADPMLHETAARKEGKARDEFDGYVATFRVAVNKYTKQGQEPITVWFSVVTFNRMAKNCAQFLKKGSKALVEGEISLDEWDGQGGEKRASLKLTASNVTFLDSKTERTNTPVASAATAPTGGTAPINDEDIPF